MERDILVQELQYYFEQKQAVSIGEEGFDGKNSRDQANWMLRRLEYYGWIETETDKSYVQRTSIVRTNKYWR